MKREKYNIFFALVVKNVLTLHAKCPCGRVCYTQHTTMRTGEKVILAILIAFAGAVGCSPFNKVLKLNDSEQMYQAAVKYYDTGDYSHALQLFQELAPRYASTMRADTILYYTGCCFYKKGDFEPIISEEQWDACHKIMQSRTKTFVDSNGHERCFGHRISSDPWLRKLKCHCGGGFKRYKWRVNKKSGQEVYGYSCYARNEWRKRLVARIARFS